MITEGYLARHYQGRSGGKDYALLDVGQDYALKVLSDEGLFDLGLVFKGGTALRKYRAGNLGRFSTDLDFAVSDPGVGELVMDTLQGAEIFDVQFRVSVETPGRRGRLSIASPLGSPGIDARLEIAHRAPWLAPETLLPVTFPVHRGYEFTPVPLPVMALEEALAEKLAAFRRRALLRDLYDLAWFARQGAIDEDKVRRLTYLKVYVDVVQEGLGQHPFSAGQDILGWTERDFPSEDIGLLGGVPHTREWLDVVKTRFDFLSRPGGDESRWAACDARDSFEVSRVIAAL